MNESRVGGDIRDDAEVHVDARVGERRRARRERVLARRAAGAARSASALAAASHGEALHLAALLVDADEHGRSGSACTAAVSAASSAGSARHVVAHEDEARDARVDERPQRRGVGARARAA